MAGRRRTSPLPRFVGVAAALALVATHGEAIAESEGVESGEAVDKKKHEDNAEGDEDDSYIGYFADPWFCWFGWPRWSGRPCEFKKPKRKRTPEGKPIHDDLGCPGEDIDGYLNKFCGHDFEEDQYFYCPCCADHLMGDLPRRASLLVPGRATEVPAWQRDSDGEECRVGYLRTYTLGGDRTPTAWCDRGRLTCECSDPNTEWHEEELWCSKGPQCQAPIPPEELHFETQGPLEAGDRVRSVQDIEYKFDVGENGEGEKRRWQANIDNASQLFLNMTGEVMPCPQVVAGTGITLGAGASGVVFEAQHDIVVEWDDYPQLGPALVYRPQVAKSSQSEEDNPEGLPFCLTGYGGHERMAIGYTMCDYYTIDQCHLYYSKYLDGTWNFCEIDPHHVRVCGASIMTLADAEQRAGRWLDWAIEWGWRPSYEPQDWEVWPFSYHEERLIIEPEHEPAPPSENVQYVLREEGHQAMELEEAAEKHKRHEHRHRYHKHHHARKHHGHHHDHHAKGTKAHSPKEKGAQDSEGEGEEE